MGRLTWYKRVDLAVQACTRLNKRLVVIGGGGEMDKLRAMAGPTIEFKGGGLSDMFGGGLTQIGYEPDGTMQIEADFNTAGTDPCHVEIAPNGAFVSVANFANGAVTIFPTRRTGQPAGR